MGLPIPTVVELPFLGAQQKKIISLSKGLENRHYMPIITIEGRAYCQGQIQRNLMMNTAINLNADDLVFAMVCEVLADLRVINPHSTAISWDEYETEAGDIFLAPERFGPVMVYRASEQHWEIARGDKLGLEVMTEAVRRAIHGFGLWELEPLLERLQQTQ
jgi:hypothetical protein